MSAEILTFADEDALFDHLCALNDAGMIAERMILIGDDREWPNPVYVRLVAPHGDDIAIAYQQYDPDTGVEHCCQCYECPAERCDLYGEKRTDRWVPNFPVSMWEPTSIRHEEDQQ